MPGYNTFMSAHEDRSPLVMKISLRQARGRLEAELASLSQLEALASNLGWEEMASDIAAARESVGRAAQNLDDAVEKAVREQAEAAHAHAHSHEHAHAHSHLHSHPHDHEHPGESDEEHDHEHTHVHEHLHEHPHDHEH